MFIYGIVVLAAFFLSFISHLVLASSNNSGAFVAKSIFTTVAIVANVVLSDMIFPGTSIAVALVCAYILAVSIIAGISIRNGAKKEEIETELIKFLIISTVVGVLIVSTRLMAPPQQAPVMTVMGAEITEEGPSSMFQTIMGYITFLLYLFYYFGFVKFALKHTSVSFELFRSGNVSPRRVNRQLTTGGRMYSRTKRFR